MVLAGQAPSGMADAIACTKLSDARESPEPQIKQHAMMSLSRFVDGERGGAPWLDRIFRNCSSRSLKLSSSPKPCLVSSA